MTKVRNTSGPHPLPSESKGAKKSQSNMGNRVVTKGSPSLAAKIEGLAGLLRGAAKNSNAISSKKRTFTKGPIE